MKSAVRPGYKPPRRQRDVQLSDAQRAALKTALEPHRLPAFVVRTIEDQLAFYRDSHARQPQGIRVVKKVYREMQRAQALARDLREFLARGLFHNPFRPQTFAEAKALSASLSDQLAQAITYLQQAADDLPPEPKHRPPDWFLPGVALAVVESLDAAGVPLTLGHRTPVVEVLGLVRSWARGRPRQARRWSNADYQYTRMIVRTYHRNLAQARAVHAATTPEKLPARRIVNPRTLVRKKSSARRARPAARGSRK